MTDLLFLIDTAYDHVSWHGTSLHGSLRGLSPQKAAWRPDPRRHNIWEVTVHAAYWKYAAWRRLTGATRGSFPLRGSNWFVRPETPSPIAWRADQALLDDTHRELRAAVAALRPGRLDAVLPGGTVTTRALVAGSAAHDLYHAGQIQLIKKLAPR